MNKVIAKLNRIWEKLYSAQEQFMQYHNTLIDRVNEQRNFTNIQFGLNHNNQFLGGDIWNVVSNDIRSAVELRTIFNMLQSHIIAIYQSLNNFQNELSMLFNDRINSRSNAGEITTSERNKMQRDYNTQLQLFFSTLTNQQSSYYPEREYLPGENHSQFQVKVYGIAHPKSHWESIESSETLQGVPVDPNFPADGSQLNLGWLSLLELLENRFNALVVYLYNRDVDDESTPLYAHIQAKIAEAAAAAAAAAAAGSYYYYGGSDGDGIGEDLIDLLALDEDGDGVLDFYDMTVPGITLFEDCPFKYAVGNHGTIGGYGPGPEIKGFESTLVEFGYGQGLDTALAHYINWMRFEHFPDGISTKEEIIENLRVELGVDQSEWNSIITRLNHWIPIEYRKNNWDDDTVGNRPASYWRQGNNNLLYSADIPHMKNWVNETTFTGNADIVTLFKEIWNFRPDFIALMSSALNKMESGQGEMFEY